MKKYLFALTLSLLSFMAKAQLPGSYPAAPELIMMGQPNGITAGKGTGTDERLVAVARTDNMQYDSVYFWYAAGRGSKLINSDVNGSYYEYLRYYPNTTDLVIPNPDYSVRRQPNLLFDSSLRYVDYYPTQETTLVVTTRRYNHPGTEMTEFTDETYSAPWGVEAFHKKAVFTYNTNKQLTNTTYYLDTARVPNHNYLYFSGFRSTYVNNRIVSDTTTNTPGGKAMEYAYDGAGNLIRVSHISYFSNGNVLETFRNTYAYNAGNKLIRHLTVKINPGNTIQNLYVDTLDYNGTQLKSVISHAWDLNINNWDAGVRSMAVYNISGYIDSVKTFNITQFGLVPATITRYTYNANNHFKERYFYDLVNSTSGTDRFYYEPYTPNAAASVTAHDDLAVLYPVPATERLHIRMKQAANNAVSIMIYNSLGQLVLDVKDLRQMQYTVPVRLLPAGRYVAVIRSDNKSAHLSFTKQ